MNAPAITASDDVVPGTYDNITQINALLVRAIRAGYLVSPTRQVLQLHPGLAVALTTLHVDARPTSEGGHIYPLEDGSWALSSRFMEHVAREAGVRWDGVNGRVDNGKLPHCCRYRAVGSVFNTDATDLWLSAERDLDMRDGSERVQALYKRLGREDGGEQIRNIRLHLLAHAETRARSAATRKLGLEPSYAREALDRPFVVARVIYTGHTDDPVLRRELARVAAEKMLGASRALYGPRRGLDAPAPPPAAPSQAKQPPAPQRQATPPPRTAATAMPRREIQRPAAANHNGGELTIPAGYDEGKPLSKTGTKSLQYWRKRLEGALRSGRTKPRFRAKDRALFDAIVRELQRRERQPSRFPVAPAADGEAW